nr:atherin-like [Equus asinus]
MHSPALGHPPGPASRAVLERSEAESRPSRGPLLPPGPSRAPGTPRGTSRAFFLTPDPSPTPAATCPCRHPALLVPARSQPQLRLPSRAAPCPGPGCVGGGCEQPPRQSLELAGVGALGWGRVPLPLDLGDLQGLGRALPVHGSSRRAPKTLGEKTRSGKRWGPLGVQREFRERGSRAKMARSRKGGEGRAADASGARTHTLLLSSR